MTSLLSLPTELLQHIANYLPFSALVVLQCSNRRLRDVCKSHVVIENVARHGHHNIPGAMPTVLRTHSASNRGGFEAEQLQWHEGKTFLNNADIGAAKRIAYNVERCGIAALASAVNDDWTSHIAQGHSTYSISSWLPHLLVMHHPVTLALESRTFLRVHGEINLRAQLETSHTDAKHMADLVNVNFILSYVMLQRLSTTLNPLEVVRSFEDFYGSSTNREEVLNQAQSEEARTLKVIEKMSELVLDYYEEHYPFTLAQASSALVLLIFGLTTQLPPVAYYGNSPKPYRMSFQELMDIDSIIEMQAESFGTCHLHEMTGPEFLCGQWIGYFSDHRSVHNLRTLFDNPMSDIGIAARPLSPHDATARGARTKIDRNTRGKDAHGEFLLEGRVYANGNVDISKTYLLGSTSWVWTGHITPFGIVGHWSNEWEFGGYFWIWKEEWI
ncbi:hypothetical protein HBI23_219770 [Parastagonospora nodorum]|nr:hypothetical protein HBI47_226450 [Parastagonospora nodorum]KAH5631708.1 hypothetical protein HBI23_219770 [Parastagonospora nodorum]KAH6049135.1 hypothetical protein HBI67_220240 [Parastagonospora nodorum]KAH6056233.1 hypothetical protein HBI66_220880 [Parastagonospora nodorum]